MYTKRVKCRYNTYAVYPMMSGQWNMCVIWNNKNDDYHKTDCDTERGRNVQHEQE